jgi:hypothetical protein
MGHFDWTITKKYLKFLGSPAPSPQNKSYIFLHYFYMV